ncbi:MAG: biotin-dependent carboxyltransferase family protein [Deltaproteobacteria bacterium]|nr:biotin-dependent carboxyltransferase family protein [Deltaproteobacteria bacterium]
MTLLTIRSPGALASVQDLGRPAFQHLGVPSGGAADPVALRIANALAGNGPGAAGLELTLGGFHAEFRSEAACGLAGADLGFQVDGRPLPPDTAFVVRPGSRLRSRGRVRGCRAYLAIHGGIDVPLVLGSRSTYAPAGLGGFEGRALRSGDELPGKGGVPVGWRADLRPTPDIVPPYPAPGSPVVLRAVRGPQASAFTAAGLATFFTAEFAVSPHADRMGYRLEGPRVEHAAEPDIVSDGPAWGSVQVPGDGWPIVLLSDRQTTGGYAKIATVITRDVPLLAQAVPGDSVRFREVDLWEARTVSMAAERRLRDWEERAAVSD